MYFFPTNYKSWTSFLLSVEILFHFPWRLHHHNANLWSLALYFVHIFCLGFWVRFFPCITAVHFTFICWQKLAEDTLHFSVHKKWICNESFKVFPKIFSSTMQTTHTTKTLAWVHLRRNQKRFISHFSTLKKNTVSWCHLDIITVFSACTVAS